MPAKHFGMKDFFETVRQLLCSKVCFFLIISVMGQFLNNILAQSLVILKIVMNNFPKLRKGYSVIFIYQPADRNQGINNVCKANEDRLDKGIPLAAFQNTFAAGNTVLYQTADAHRIFSVAAGLQHTGEIGKRSAFETGSDRVKVGALQLCIAFAPGIGFNSFKQDFGQIDGKGWVDTLTFLLHLSLTNCFVWSIITIHYKISYV